MASMEGSDNVEMRSAGSHEVPEDVRTGAALAAQERALRAREEHMRRHAIEHGYDDAPDAELRAALLRARRARKGY